MNSPMRDFDPRLVGRLECATWVNYYRRQWARFLLAAIRVTRHAFALPWPRTLRGAWLVLRANQLWAPASGNDPDGARRCMRRFYELVADQHGESFDVAEAARLEVEWWRLHRELPAEGRESAELELTGAIAALYSCVYSVDAVKLEQAAAERTLAMRHSDRWVTDGCDPQSPRIAEEGAALVRSYAALLAAVHR
jgi:hypothetical protein